MLHPSPEATLRIATERLSVAEAELAKALSELPTSERADKAMVTERLRLALAEIVAAKRALSMLLDVLPPADESEPRADDRD